MDKGGLLHQNDIAGVNEQLTGQGDGFQAADRDHDPVWGRMDALRFQKLLDDNLP